MVWTELQNVRFLKESNMRMSGFRIPTLKCILFRSEINWRSESSYFGWAVHRRDAGSNQERVRDWAYASGRLKPGTVRRVSVGRSRDRVDGWRAWAWVRLQLGWNLQVEMWQARNTYTSLNAFCHFQWPQVKNDSSTPTDPLRPLVGHRSRMTVQSPPPRPLVFIAKILRFNFLQRVLQGHHLQKMTLFEC